MLYLSWSIFQLASWLVFGLVVVLVALKTKKFKKKHLTSAYFVFILFTLWLAIDVGTRQEFLQRSSFNEAIDVKVIEKKDVKRYNSKDAEESFKSTLKEKNQ